MGSVVDNSGRQSNVFPWQPKSALHVFPPSREIRQLLVRNMSSNSSDEEYEIGVKLPDIEETQIWQKENEIVSTF